MITTTLPTLNALEASVYLSDGPWKMILNYFLPDAIIHNSMSSIVIFILFQFINISVFQLKMKSYFMLVIELAWGRN